MEKEGAVTKPKRPDISAPLLLLGALMGGVLYQIRCQFFTSKQVLRTTRVGAAIRLCSTKIVYQVTLYAFTSNVAWRQKALLNACTYPSNMHPLHSRAFVTRSCACMPAAAYTSGTFENNIISRSTNDIMHIK